MISTFCIFLSLILGSYKQEFLTEEIKSEINDIQPLVETFLNKKGYNGLFPNGPIAEVWSKVVNGKLYIVKKNYDTFDKSMCIQFYKDFYGKSEVIDAKICNSVLEII